MSRKNAFRCWEICQNLQYFAVSLTVGREWCKLDMTINYGEDVMDGFEEIYLEDCPCCGGVGCVEEEGGWCVYVQCLDCGAHTSPVAFESGAERLDAARRAAANWNMRKVIAPGPGE